MSESLTLHGRTKKKLINLPEEWEELVDLSTVTVHLTEVGAKQNLIVKRVQGLEVHLQTQGIPVDCYYMVVGDLLDIKEQSWYNNQTYIRFTMEDEYLSRCVVDTVRRKVHLYSDEGDTKTVECETVEEFMNVLHFVRDNCPEDMLTYTNPLDDK